MNRQKPPYGIEWTRVWGWPGYTWNPIAGCMHGCAWKIAGKKANCYAEDDAHGLARAAYPHGFEHHYWRPHALKDPGRVKRPSGIFIGSMADIMGSWVPEDQIRQVLKVCNENRQHIFFILTKNPQRLRQFNPYPPNVWVGASTPPDFMWGPGTGPGKQLELSEIQKSAMLKTTLSALRKVDASVKWLSIEPLSFDVSDALVAHAAPIDWAVVGAASNDKEYYAPETAHFTRLMRMMDYMEIPVFFKGNLHCLPEADSNWRENFPVIQGG